MNKKYTHVFKKSAVVLAEYIGAREAGAILSVPPRYIYAWRRDASVLAGPSRSPLPGESAEQGFARAEKELAELKAINAILRKAWLFYTYPCKMDIALARDTADD